MKTEAELVNRVHDMTTYDPGFWPNKGRICFLVNLKILLSLLMQSFSIEIVWQITSVTVKSCEQLAVHLVDPVIYSFPAKAMLFYIISSVIDRKSVV